MGNRAVMVFADEDGLINDLSPCIYLHLNGGKDSIAPLLSVSKSLGYFNNRHPGDSRNHVAALGGQWLKDGEPLDTGISREYSGWELDNGIYVVDSNGDISKRINAPSEEELEHPFVEEVEKIMKAHVESVCKPFEYEYMMLNRLKLDCETFLGKGARKEKHLWALDARDQISEMKRLLTEVPIAPEWLSLEDIEGYEEKMLNNSDGAEHQTQQTQDDDFSPGM